MHFRSGGTGPGRDGCRAPLPWSAQASYAGFGSTTGPWLPQPADRSSYAADRQSTDPQSMLSLYRDALGLRRTEPGFQGRRVPGHGDPCCGPAAGSRGDEGCGTVGIWTI
ncbi:hypothetical protein GA0115254_104047 [Streptomyces sp. Ncost-T10-10d]|nr:hypothetical protein GA0115254_104047 [Streptomyces sp. Ncost-T10-10d]